jgi:GntR family transcriptional regulator
VRTLDHRTDAGAAGAEPRYVAVYRQLARDIAEGRLAPGERLPSERVLCQQLEISRETLRRALELLVEDGTVSSSAGRGWIVTDGPLAPASFVSFTGMGHARGLQASAEVLEAHVRPATLDEAEALRMVAGNDLFELRRRRQLDGAVVALDHSRLPLARCPGLVDVDWSAASLYAELESRAGISADRCSYVVDAVAADADQARLLEVPEGSPLLVNEQFVLDQNGRPIELGRIVYRPDRFRFRAELNRRHA